MDITLFAAPSAALHTVHKALASLTATLREAAHPIPLSTPEIMARALRQASADLHRAADTLDHGAKLVDPASEEPAFNPWFRALTTINDGEPDPRKIIPHLTRASEIIAGSQRHHLDDPAIRLIVLQLAHLYRVGGKIPQLDFDRLMEKCAAHCEFFASSRAAAPERPTPRPEGFRSTIA